MRYIVGFLLTFNLAAALASGWNCRNLEVEISCNNGKCKVSDGFTPLDAYFGMDQNISIGMYTGVWEGKSTSIETGDYLIVIGKDLIFSTSNDMKANFLVTLDKKDRIALIKGYGYAMPMTCKAWGKNK